MSKKNKPTIMEMKTVVSNVILEIKSIYEYVTKIDSALFSYIEMKNDHDAFIKWMKEKTEKLAEEEKKNDAKSGNSSRRTGTTNTRKQTSKKSN
tara:strand:- start:28858 stop:29139 length:282 start_codon:yes stop_codon:yes gene_type:complete